MLTGMAVGAGIMLIYLALFGFAGRKLRSIDDGSENEHAEGGRRAAEIADRWNRG